VARTSLPKLADDPDARLVRWGWIAWGALTVFLAIRYALLRGGASGMQILTSVQLAALWILWPLYRGLRALWYWLRAAPYAAWNGNYYEFDGRQVRVLFDDDTLFVVADDVHAVLGLSNRATDPARVRAVAGRDGLVPLPGRRQLVFTERGLFAWLERRNDEKAVAFKRWIEKQVIAPHRKRRPAS
jgi:hypothetical protein